MKSHDTRNSIISQFLNRIMSGPDQYGLPSITSPTLPSKPPNPLDARASVEWVEKVYGAPLGIPIKEAKWGQTAAYLNGKNSSIFIDANQVLKMGGRNGSPIKNSTDLFDAYVGVAAHEIGHIQAHHHPSTYSHGLANSYVFNTKVKAYAHHERLASPRPSLLSKYPEYLGDWIAEIEAEKFAPRAMLGPHAIEALTSGLDSHMYKAHVADLPNILETINDAIDTSLRTGGNSTEREWLKLLFPDERTRTSYVTQRRQFRVNANHTDLNTILGVSPADRGLLPSDITYALRRRKASPQSIQHALWMVGKAPISSNPHYARLSNAVGARIIPHPETMLTIRDDFRTQPRVKSTGTVLFQQREMSNIVSAFVVPKGQPDLVLSPEMVNNSVLGRVTPLSISFKDVDGGTHIYSQNGGGEYRTFEAREIIQDPSTGKPKLAPTKKTHAGGYGPPEPHILSIYADGRRKITPFNFDAIVENSTTPKGILDGKSGWGLNLSPTANAQFGNVSPLTSNTLEDAAHKIQPLPPANYYMAGDKAIPMKSTTSITHPSQLPIKSPPNTVMSSHRSARNMVANIGKKILGSIM